MALSQLLHEAKIFPAKARSRVGSLTKPSLAQRDELYGYLFIAPQLCGILFFVLGPVVATFVFSFQQRNLITGETSFTGLDNYRYMFTTDPFFMKVLGNSLIFAGGLIPLNVGLALILAILLNRRFSGNILFRTIFFAPVITSAVAWAIVWRFLLQGEQGSINQFLALAGIDGPNWLREPGWAMVSVIVTRVFKNVGLNMVLFLAALANLPPDYREAAQVDGANRWQVFRYVTLPLLAPTTLMVVIITMIGSLKVFDHILLMTQGGPANSTMVLVYYIYYQAFQFFETGYASSLAMVLFTITLLLTICQWSLRRKLVHYEP